MAIPPSQGTAAMNQSIRTASKREPWNKGKLVGQKAPLRLKDIWAIRIRLQLGERIRELAMFNLAVDSKLRSCDLVKLRVRDIAHGDRVAARAVIMQQKTQRPVQFEITEQTREAVASWIKLAGLRAEDFRFPSALVTARLDTAIRANCAKADQRYRARRLSLRDPHPAPHQGFPDLPSHEEPSRRPVAIWACQAREHRAVPRNRS